MKRELLSLLGVVLLPGCVHFTNYDLTPGSQPHVDKSGLPPTEHRGGSRDWGMSLSGGGIRSCAFSIGAMKALYDRNYLDHLDIVSTVSGGGYAWYWLLSQNDPNQRFGRAVFDDAIWPRKDSELQLLAKFVPPGLTFKCAVLPPPWPAHKYEEQILVFGQSRYCTNEQEVLAENLSAARNQLLTSYLPDIRSGAIPFFIVNATLKTDRERAAKLIEISPAYIGNSTFGYHRWDTTNRCVLTAPKAIAISGAAIPRKLAQKVPDYINGRTKMTLYDGGGGPGAGANEGENLGAFALIRRGVPNVIIVDAEADPNYEFGSYVKLKCLLEKQEGISLRVTNIEAHLNRPAGAEFNTAPFSIGSATRAGVSSHF